MHDNEDENYLDSEGNLSTPQTWSPESREDEQKTKQRVAFPTPTGDINKIPHM